MNTNLYKQSKGNSNSINVNNNKPAHVIQVNSRKRGSSTNSNIRLVPKNNANQTQKASAAQVTNPLLSSIITQVPNKASANLKKENKSHSYSPNRMLSTMHLSLLPPKTTTKKTLVLDLDETLVHSDFTPFTCPSDIVFPIEFENVLHDIHVLIRPGVSEFLQKMSQKYEIVIFTASIAKYADPLLDILDKNGYCQHRLFREHCTLVHPVYIKDLKRLGRDLKDVIIVDNCAYSYWLNPENGLPILSWFKDKNDRELQNITPILEFLADVPDVREHIKKIVIDDEIWYSKAMAHINSYNSLMAKKNKKKNTTNNSNSSSTTNKSIKKEKDNSIKDNDNSTIINNNNKQLQQININIINNNITNYICNDNQKENDINESNQIEKGETTPTSTKQTNTNNALKQKVTFTSCQNNQSSDGYHRKLSFISKKAKNINSFRNLAVVNPIANSNDVNSNNISNGNIQKFFHHKKRDSLHGENAYNKNAFLKSTSNYITTSSSNSKQINTINLTNVDFLKNNQKKNHMKYSPNHHLLNKTNLRHGTSSSVNIKKSSREMDLKRKSSKHKIANSTNLGYKTSTNFGHTKSLSFNFDVSGVNNKRPKSSKKFHYSNNNITDSKKNVNNLRFELNEILQKRGISKSSRATDNKDGFKYGNVVMGGDINNCTSNNNNVKQYSIKYTNKIIKQ